MQRTPANGGNVGMLATRPVLRILDGSIKHRESLPMPEFIITLPTATVPLYWDGRGWRLERSKAKLFESEERARAFADLVARAGGGSVAHAVRASDRR